MQPVALPSIPPHATDAEHAALAAQGNVAAFESIMRRHNRLLFRTARSILKNDADTEDALQEAYLRALAIAGRLSRRGQGLDLAGAHRRQ